MAIPDNQGGKRAADVIVTALEARITSGELENDKPLPPERDLMEEFGTSRTVVREAISSLANRGLIELRPRFRPIVRKPDYGTLLSATGTIVRYLLNEPGGVQNLYQSRVFIERGLVRDAALNATKENISDLKAALLANEKALDHSEEFFRTDIAFHGVLYRIGNNPIFPAMHEGFTSWLSPNWARMTRSDDHNRSVYLDHKAIYDAILERDPARAEEALIAHLSAAWSYVEETF
ncbi:FCD domain-containing protein [uncultured Roseibium sp.]|uniref:FCD domain-containing protein n=1 Tax=uncultured Roseibium sp. TaxID=1936171 RepID=UPI00261FB5E6|nr:FCD domain-containing protein [uncultured Roseibium sp.]